MMCPSNNYPATSIKREFFRPWEACKFNTKSHIAPEHFTIPPQLSCDMCTSVFKRESELKRHKASKHSEKRELCKICLKDFTRKDNLTRHMKLAHSNENKPNCKYCQKTLSRKDAVQRHESTCSKKVVPVDAVALPRNQEEASGYRTLSFVPFEVPAKLRRKIGKRLN